MKVSAQTEWTALVGRRDRPADGVRDYCAFLARALGCRSILMTISEVPWAEQGWIRAWIDLFRRAGAWKSRWVLLQYTALSWSRRGIPFAAIAIMAVLRSRGTRTAIVFHDWDGYAGSRSIDRLRRACQRWTMRRVASLADRGVFPVPPERVSWLRGFGEKAVFIPVGANLASPLQEPSQERAAGPAVHRPTALTIAVYGITGGEPGKTEVGVIATTLKRIASRLPAVRLVVFGRGSEQSRPAFEQALQGIAVELSVLGLLPADDVTWHLSRADALLFVRGEISGQRGSAIAGIACGVPVVGYGHPERAFPLSEAGLLLVPPGDTLALGEALERVLTEPQLQADLRRRNRCAWAKYFSWDGIARRFAETLTDD